MDPHVVASQGRSLLQVQLTSLAGPVEGSGLVQIPLLILHRCHEGYRLQWGQACHSDVHGLIREGTCRGGCQLEHWQPAKGPSGISCPAVGEKALSRRLQFQARGPDKAYIIGLAKADFWILVQNTQNIWRRGNRVCRQDSLFSFYIWETG